MTTIEFKRHQRFWFSDGSLHLLVEDTLYRVHHYLFDLHAKNFPVVKGESQADGQSLANQSPYILDGVKQADFNRLLAYLYPCNIAVEEDKTSDDWVSILNLALKWDFESLRSKAISKVAELASPIDKVVLGREHDIKELLLPGYMALCQSTAPLSQEEGRRLGLEVVISIYRVRQELWGRDVKSVAVHKVQEKVDLYFFGKAPAVAAPVIASTEVISASPSVMNGPNHDSGEDANSDKRRTKPNLKNTPLQTPLGSKGEIQRPESSASLNTALDEEPKEVVRMKPKISKGGWLARPSV